MSSAIEPYTLLRAALALFEKPPAELLPEELELEDSIEDDLAIEKIKEEEIKKATKKK